MLKVPVFLAMGCAQFIGFNLSGTLVLTTLISLLPLWLAFVSFSSRSLRVSSNGTNVSSTKPVYLGQPRLLGARVSHTRLGPGQYNYTVPHFLVGTPIGLRGSVGRVLSLDEASSAIQADASWYVRLRQYLTTKMWFTVHAHHHLDKGNNSIGLQGKLRNFLQAQGEDPDEWPYAYLVTLPQFVGYQRNLVCFWFLYSASRELTASIMEVNNYWGHRKIAFSRLTGETLLPGYSESASFPEKLSAASTQGSPVSFQHSNPRYRTYRGTWDKDMFISPFEKVEGTITLRYSDPLAPNGRLHITTTLLDKAGKARLTGQVMCTDDHEFVDALGASPWRLLRFLPYWTGVQVLTMVIVIASAMRIQSRGPQSFYPAPEARPNIIPRDETPIERELEAPLRQYLQYLVQHSGIPVRLRYIPPRSHLLQSGETFSSPSCTADSATLTIQVLTPQFYTSIFTYADAHSAFMTESRPSSLPTDPSSRMLSVSDRDLLVALLGPSPISSSGSAPRRQTGLTGYFLSWLRGTGETSFMDWFINTQMPHLSVQGYERPLLVHLLAERIPLGSHSMVEMYATLVSLLVQAGLAYVFWRGLVGLTTRALI